MTEDAFPHSHCALCSQTAAVTIRPATKWRGTRIAHDLCFAHLFDGIARMWADGVPWVEVGQVQERPHLPYWP